MKHRKRNQSLTIRLTESEKQYMKRKAVQSKMSLTNYIIALSLGKSIDGSENVTLILTKLKSIGDKLNHVETEIKAGNFETEYFQEILDMQNNLYEKLFEMARNQSKNTCLK